ncbi:50S ribosomal protein L9 [Spirochaetota bacterium]|nr:50S ribosomal protein L9 [Spirochaetota bacterium]
MEIILIKEVSTLGNPGDIVTVKNGYARNYLIPQKLAVRKTATSLKILEKQRADFDKIIAERSTTYSDLLERIKEIEAVTIPVKASKEGKLYAAINVMTIQEYLTTLYNIEIDKQKIIIRKPIKTLGEHPVTIMISKQHKTTLNVITELLET